MEKKGGEDPQAEMRARLQKLKGKVSNYEKASAKNSMINESYKERRAAMNAGIAEREKADLAYKKGIKSVRITSIDIPFGEIFWLSFKAVIASGLIAVFIGLFASVVLGIFNII